VHAFLNMNFAAFFCRETSISERPSKSWLDQQHCHSHSIQGAIIRKSGHFSFSQFKLGQGGKEESQISVGRQILH
jgi:hypothetical protein